MKKIAHKVVASMVLSCGIAAMSEIVATVNGALVAVYGSELTGRAHA